MQEYILAHDLGTSGNKATLYNLKGKLAASLTVPYETQTPANGFVDQMCIRDSRFPAFSAASP